MSPRVCSASLLTMADEDQTPDAPAEQQGGAEAGQDPAAAPQGPGAAQADPAAAAQEEELRKRLEEELRRLRIEDVLLQSVVSLINLTSRRIAKPDEQDLEQARLGIEAVRALVDLLPDEAAEQVRQALSELQVAYASEAGGGAAPTEGVGGGGAESGGGAPSSPGAAPEEQKPGLWTPHDRSS
jgi:hypothetical protein